jgi:uncharacterized protein
MNNSIDQQFVEFIIKSLVSNPDAVKVERRIDEKGVLLELTVAPDDLGRVIGKRGATAQSVRTLLRALGTKNDARYNLKIVDNGEGAPSHSDQSSDLGSEYSRRIDDKDSDNDRPVVHDEEEDAEEAERQEVHQTSDQSSVVSKTRKELEELDDLDV